MSFGASTTSLVEPAGISTTWLKYIVFALIPLKVTTLCTAQCYTTQRHALNQNERADTILEALESDQPDSAFAGKELALLRYARQLTLTPGHIEKGDVERLRSAGATDGEILEVNQVVAYFNYANRVLNGLGVTTEGDVLGTSPRTR